MDVEKLISEWEVKREEYQKRFQKHFPDSDDLLAIVLRGHLFTEEFLDKLNRHCFHFPDYYDQANLSYQKKLLIAQAQVLDPNPKFIFTALTKLNELRNNLAHNLDSPRLKGKLHDFLNLVESKFSENIGNHFDFKNETLEKRASRAICFVLGQMEVLDNLIEFMEKSRKYGGKLDPAQPSSGTRKE